MKQKLTQAETQLGEAVLIIRELTDVVQGVRVASSWVLIPNAFSWEHPLLGLTDFAALTPRTISVCGVAEPGDCGKGGSPEVSRAAHDLPPAAPSHMPV